MLKNRVRGFATLNTYRRFCLLVIQLWFHLASADLFYANAFVYELYAKKTQQKTSGSDLEHQAWSKKQLPFSLLNIKQHFLALTDKCQSTQNADKVQPSVNALNRVGDITIWIQCLFNGRNTFLLLFTLRIQWSLFHVIECWLLKVLILQVVGD